MSNLHTHDPLHELLRTELRTAAEQAPRMPEEWAGPGVVSLMPTRPERSAGLYPNHPWRASALAIAAAVVLLVGGVAALRNRQEAPAAGGASAGSRAANVTWYEPDEVSTTVRATSVVCRPLNDGHGCDNLVGARTVVLSTPDGEIDVTTEYGPAESNAWQTLTLTGRQADLGGRQGLIVAANPELVGFTDSEGTRVLVLGEAGTEPAEVAAQLVTRTETINLPIVFGDATPSEAEMPRDSVAARYYAGYLDTTRQQACVGGIGVPWNNNPSCIPVEPDTLSITVASPSPAGTILIATVPLATARAAVTVDGGSPAELTITDASEAGYKLVFADLDGAVPLELIAYDSAGVELARTGIVSTGGAPLGYLPSTGLAG